MTYKPPRNFTDVNPAFAITRIFDVNSSPVAENDTIRNGLIEISGTATPGAPILLFSAGEQYSELAYADKFGQWSQSVLINNGPIAISASSLGVTSEVFHLNVVPSSEEDLPQIIKAYVEAPHGSGFIGNNEVIENGSPKLQGRASANTVVDIIQNGRAVASTMTDENGNWSHNLLLDEGPNHIVVSASGIMSNPYILHFQSGDAQPQPELPQELGQDKILTIISIVDDFRQSLQNGGNTSDSSPTLTGTAPPNSVVHIIANSFLVDTVYSDRNGHWTSTPQLNDGISMIHVVSGGLVSDSHTINVDPSLAQPEPIPEPILEPVLTITSIVDDFGNNLENGGNTSDSSPTLTGTAPPNSVVHIIANSFLVDTVYSDRNGHWTSTPQLNDGISMIHVVSGGLVSDSNTINVDPSLAQPEPIPEPILEPVLTITSIVDDFSNNLENGGNTSDSSPTLTGTAPPNSVVHIIANSFLVDTVYSDRNGHWTSTPQLNDGISIIHVVSGDLVSDSHTINVDPSLAQPEPIPEPILEPILTITSIVDDFGNNLENSGDTSDSSPTLTGTAPPNSVVHIIANSFLVDTVYSDRNGHWTSSPQLNDGISMIHVVSGGLVSDSHSINVDPSLVQPEPIPEPILEPILTVTSIVDDFGNNLENSGDTSDSSPTLTGTAPPNSVVHIIANSFLVDTVYSDRNGHWTSSPQLNDGISMIHVVSGGLVSDSHSINVDPSLAPPEPIPEPILEPILTITSIVDDFGKNLENGGDTNDRSPTLLGMAQPFSMVYIISNTFLVDTVYSDHQGRWSSTPQLSDGPSIISAVSGGLVSVSYLINIIPSLALAEHGTNPAQAHALDLTSSAGYASETLEFADNINNHLNTHFMNAHPHPEANSTSNETPTDNSHLDTVTPWESIPQLDNQTIEFLVNSKYTNSETLTSEISRPIDISYLLPDNMDHFFADEMIFVENIANLNLNVTFDSFETSVGTGIAVDMYTISSTNSFLLDENNTLTTI